MNDLQEEINLLSKIDENNKEIISLKGRIIENQERQIELLTYQSNLLKQIVSIMAKACSLFQQGNSIEANEEMKKALLLMFPQTH